MKRRTTGKIECCVKEKAFGFLDGATPRAKWSAGTPSPRRVRGSQTGGTVTGLYWNLIPELSQPAFE